MRNKTNRDPLSMPCWVWSRAIDVRGYGRVVRAGRPQRAHRYVYEALVGPVPEGLELDHLCFNTACVNPDHLEPVTPRVNTQRRPYCRLSMTAAAEIREQYRNGVSMRLLALKHGVNPETIRLAINGVTWQPDKT